VMRAAGVSLGRIVWSVMKVGLLFVALALVIGEGIAPAAEQRAQSLRSVAMSDKLNLGGHNGLWARDGNSFINVREVLPGKRLGQIFIYEMDGANRLTRLIHAKSAAYRKGQWVLENVESSSISPQRVTSHLLVRQPWNTRLSPDLLDVVTVKPNTLSIIGLYQYVSYLHDNGLDAALYEQALWGKLAAPLITGMMVFLAVPFVFGPLRSVGIGHRVMIGALVGIGFYLINQTFAYLGVVFAVNPAVTALLPAMLALGAALLLLRRVH
jgi:lipopolysaccharide export system permease protein